MLQQDSFIPPSCDCSEPDQKSQNMASLFIVFQQTALKTAI